MSTVIFLVAGSCIFTVVAATLAVCLVIGEKNRRKKTRQAINRPVRHDKSHAVIQDLQRIDRLIERLSERDRKSNLPVMVVDGE